VPTVSVSDGHLYFEEAGRGPAVVLAHGGGGDLSQWRHQVLDFSRGYRVIAFDARGHGQSSGATAYSIASWVDDVKALLDHLGIRRAYLIGATLGGVVLLEFALAHPEMARGLVLVSTAPDTTDEMRTRFAASAAVVESGELAAFAEGFVNFIFSPGYVGSHPAEVEEFRQRLERIDPASYAAAIRALGNRADLSPRLGALSAPALIVTGELDPIPTTAPGAQQLLSSLPNARAEVIPDAAHLPQIEQPERFNRLVLDFLVTVGKAAA
jgi:pimeloyl-ACP methyl ester carboxylesterase